jgi:hypothetical protein
VFSRPTGRRSTRSGTGSCASLQPNRPSACASAWPEPRRRSIHSRCLRWLRKRSSMAANTKSHSQSRPVCNALVCGGHMDRSARFASSSMPDAQRSYLTMLKRADVRHQCSGRVICRPKPGECEGPLSPDFAVARSRQRWPLRGNNRPSLPNQPVAVMGREPSSEPVQASDFHH